MPLNDQRSLPKRYAVSFARSVLGLDIRRAAPREFDLQLYPADRTATRRLAYFYDLMLKIAGVDGDIVEYGVGGGNALFAFSVMSTMLRTPRHIWGFDTFEGLPAPSKSDGATNVEKEGYFSYSKAHVIALLEHNGLDETFISERVNLVPGNFTKSLHHYEGAPIAFLHIDVDFYDSYKSALEILFEYVVVGGIIAFDEYRDGGWPGATQAIDEFFADRPEEIIRSPIVKKFYTVKVEE